MSPRLHKGLFAVKEATMPYIQSAVHAFEPSYARHPKQSFTGGIYQPLADESMTDTPLHFKARHRAELYTQKTLLRTEATHRSIYIPAAEASLQHAIQIFLRFRMSSILPLLPQRNKYLTTITHYRRHRAPFKRFRRR